MDTQTIDEEFDKLKTEFQDVAATVTSLSEKMTVAKAAGDANAAEWLEDLKLIAKDIDDEQLQTHRLLHTIHNFITSSTPAEPQPAPQADEKPALFASNADQQQAQTPQRRGLFSGAMGGGIMGGGMMGGGMMGGYGGSSFGRAMEMGMGMSLGANLMRGIFR